MRSLRYLPVVASARLWLLSQPAYWRSRDRLQRVALAGRVWRYGLARRSTASRDELAVAGGLARQLLPMLLIGAAAVVLLDLLSRGVVALSDSQLAKVLASGPDSATYSPFLLATAAFGATLLALFFTALSVVVSTGYARVPVEVRALLLTERAGAVYTKTVGLLVVICLLLLAASFLGYDPPALTLIGIALLGSAAVLGLLVLGPRAFSFFDAAALAAPLRREFRTWVDHATRGGGGEPFERHYQRQASATLETYGMLISVARGSGDVAGDQLEALSRDLVRVWLSYARSKPHIPPKSLWFERLAAHRDWLKSHDIVLQTALATGTGLPPEEEPDRVWVERRIAAMLATAMDVLLRSGRGEGAYRIGLMLADLTHRLAAALQFDAAALALGILTKQRHSLVNKSTDEAVSLDSQLRYAVLDAQALAVIALVLGLRQAADYIATPRFWNDVKLVLRSGTGTTDSPLGAVLDYLETLRSALAFEVRADGKRVTPDWWLRQMIARRLCQTVMAALDQVRLAINDDLLGAADKADDPVAAGLLTARALEATDKGLTHVGSVLATLDRLESARRSKDEYWPERNDERIKEQLRSLNDGCFDGFARLLPALAAVVDQSVPDYFGQAYTALVMECFECLRVGRDQRFTELFPPVFAGGWSAFNRIRASLPAPPSDARHSVVLLSGPVIDLLELSGYALLRRELGGTAAWDSCRETWDKYFAAVSDPAAAAQQVVSLVDLRDFPALLPGDLVRTSRAQAFHHQLAETLGIEDAWATRFSDDPVHESPIIQLAAGMTFSHDDVVGLFVSEYLSTRLPAGIELPARAKAVAESLVMRRKKRGRRRPRAAADEEPSDE